MLSFQEKRLADSVQKIQQFNGILFSEGQVEFTLNLNLFL